MTKFLTCFFAALLFAVPIAVGLGVVYFYLAATVVDIFHLNRGKKPIGFRFLNAALALTIVSYFLIVAFLLRNM